MIDAMEQSLRKAKVLLEELIVLKKAMKNSALGEHDRLLRIYGDKCQELATIKNIYIKQWESIFAIANHIDIVY